MLLVISADSFYGTQVNIYWTVQTYTLHTKIMFEHLAMIMTVLTQRWYFIFFLLTDKQYEIDEVFMYVNWTGVSC